LPPIIRYLCLCDCRQTHAKEEPTKYDAEDFGKRQH
jgi:hypothetical protein